jgi:predicted DNA-binding transcriptional regulator AlpA
LSDEFLCPKEFARLIEVHPNTLGKWRTQGRGPRYEKLGKGIRAKIRYRRSEIEKWLAENAHRNTSEYTLDQRGSIGGVAR